MDNYVFGYGSLIESASRTRTNPDAIGAWPAEVTGYRRGWFHQFVHPVGYSCTYLGAFEKPKATMNGVIYKVDNLEATIQREQGYKATKLDADQIKILDRGKPWSEMKNSTVYIFVSHQYCISKTKEPTKDLPMVQSYVDICITGCQEQDQMYRTTNGTFTQDFINSTIGWNKYWVNDRTYPRRAQFTVPSVSAIDKALHQAGLLKYVQLNDVR